jgi:hypothetical protein
MGDSFAGLGWEDQANTEPSAKPRSPAHNAVMTWLRSFPESVGAGQAIDYIESLEMEIAQNRRDAASIAGVRNYPADAMIERIEQERNERYETWLRANGAPTP